MNASEHLKKAEDLLISSEAAMMATMEAVKDGELDEDATAAGFAVVNGWIALAAAHSAQAHAMFAGQSADMDSTLAQYAERAFGILDRAFI